MTYGLHGVCERGADCDGIHADLTRTQTRDSSIVATLTRLQVTQINLRRQDNVNPHTQPAGGERRPGDKGSHVEPPEKSLRRH